MRDDGVDWRDSKVFGVSGWDWDGGRDTRLFLELEQGDLFVYYIRDVESKSLFTFISPAGVDWAAFYSYPA